MKPLTIITILLIVVANATFTYLGINYSIIERTIDLKNGHVSADKPGALHVMPIAGSVALVGASLLMGGNRGNRSRSY